MFRRDGLNIHSDVFISIAQAILGGTATGQGLYETISIVVSKKTSSQVQTTFSFTPQSPLTVVKLVLRLFSEL